VIYSLQPKLLQREQSECFYLFTLIHIQFFFKRYALLVLRVKLLSVEWKNDKEGLKSALHICAIGRRTNQSEWKGLEMAELLLQNNAKMNSLDKNQHCVLDAAVLGNGEREMVEYLTSRIS